MDGHQKERIAPCANAIKEGKDQLEYHNEKHRYHHPERADRHVHRRDLFAQCDGQSAGKKITLYYVNPGTSTRSVRLLIQSYDPEINEKTMLDTKGELTITVED